MGFDADRGLRRLKPQLLPQPPPGRLIDSVMSAMSMGFHQPIFAWLIAQTHNRNEAWTNEAHQPTRPFLPGKSARLNPASWLPSTASAPVQVLEEFLQVPGSSEEETRQDQILAEAPDLAEVSAQAAEWAEPLVFLNKEPDTA